GRIRTGATSGVATRYLAREDAQVFAVVGTGRQAMAQVAAALTVRPIREVIVAARDAEKTEAFARRIEERFSVRVRAAATVAEAAQAADVVTTVTTASAPILGPGMIRPDAHVNAVGAVIP